MCLLISTHVTCVKVNKQNYNTLVLDVFVCVCVSLSLSLWLSLFGSGLATQRCTWVCEGQRVAFVRDGEWVYLSACSRRALRCANAWCVLGVRAVDVCITTIAFPCPFRLLLLNKRKPFFPLIFLISISIYLHPQPVRLWANPNIFQKRNGENLRPWQSLRVRKPVEISYL